LNSAVFSDKNKVSKYKIAHFYFNISDIDYATFE